jgi:hypothetical protein
MDFDMVATFRATREKRIYNRWVANETTEDFALRFTARRYSVSWLFRFRIPRLVAM